MPLTNPSPQPRYVTGDIVPVTMQLPPAMMHNGWYRYDANAQTLTPVTVDEIQHAAQTMDFDDGMH